MQIRLKVLFGLLIICITGNLLSGCGKGSDLEGKIEDESGHALRGVTIVAIQVQPIKNYEQFMTTSGSDGVFQFKRLYPGSSYVLKAKGKNWSAIPKDNDTIVSAPNGETTILSHPLKITRAITSEGSIVMNLETGMCRFEKDSYGNISDAKTSLQWFVLPGQMTWFEARFKIMQMGDGWRFPRMGELKNLFIEGLGECNIDPVFKLKYGHPAESSIWSDHTVKGFANSLFVDFFIFSYGTESTVGGLANEDRLRAFAVRNLEAPSGYQEKLNNDTREAGLSEFHRTYPDDTIGDDKYSIFIDTIIYFDTKKPFWTSFESIKIPEHCLITLKATGNFYWDTQVSEPYVGPEGASWQPRSKQFPVPQANIVCLICRVGSQVEVVGKEVTFQAIEAGHLELALNERWQEGCWDDNSGILTINVSVREGSTK